MSKEITVRENYSIEKPKDMAAMANVLKAHVVKHGLYSSIKGKNYCQVEGWQYAGGLMGLFPRVSKVENLSSTGEIKWKADVEIVELKTGEVKANGFALCSSKEANKKGFDEYAILSMAQTRAIGKAYRNLIGWVMKLAGYEGAPSEEMHKVDQTPAAADTYKGQDVGFEDHLCAVCGKDLTRQGAALSKKVTGKEFCKEHFDEWQTKHKSKK